MLGKETPKWACAPRAMAVFALGIGLGGCTTEAGGVAAPQVVEQASGQSSGNSGGSSAAPSGNGLGPSGSGSETNPGSGLPFGTSSGFGVASGAPYYFGSSSADNGATMDAGTDAAPQDGGVPPCDIQQLLASRCQACHGPVPLNPAPMTLETVADLKAKSLADPSKTFAEEAIVRMHDTVYPMPQPPMPAVTLPEIATLQNWISAGYPAAGCSETFTVYDGGMPPDAAPPYDGPVTCSSGHTFSFGNGPMMNPGDQCDSCHVFTVAGTVYETEHEPLYCDGVGVSGANVVVTDSQGRVTTVPVNSVGNFYATSSISGPFQAKIVYQGRERDMMAAQASGNCNMCHSANGDNSAPGRIMLP
jgi:mono/diheme cytochrome c family protein